MSLQSARSNLTKTLVVGLLFCPVPMCVCIRDCILYLPSLSLATHWLHRRWRRYGPW